MPVEAALLIFGGLGAAVLSLYLLNRLSDHEDGVLDETGGVRAEYKKSDEAPHNWTGWEG